MRVVRAVVLYSDYRRGGAARQGGRAVVSRPAAQSAAREYFGQERRGARRQQGRVYTVRASQRRHRQARRRWRDFRRARIKVRNDARKAQFDGRRGHAQTQNRRRHRIQPARKKYRGALLHLGHAAQLSVRHGACAGARLYEYRQRRTVGAGKLLRQIPDGRGRVRLYFNRHRGARAAVERDAVRAEHSRVQRYAVARC